MSSLLRLLTTRTIAALAKRLRLLHSQLEYQLTHHAWKAIQGNIETLTIQHRLKNLLENFRSSGTA